MSYRADKLGVDAHARTHTQTDAGNGNTRRPKLASGKKRKHSNKKLSGVVSTSSAPGRDLDKTNHMENINIAKLDMKDSTVVISKSKKRKIDFRFDTCDYEYSDPDIGPKAKIRRHSVVKSSGTLPNISVNNRNSIKNTRKRIPDRHINKDDSDSYDEEEFNTNPGKKWENIPIRNYLELFQSLLHRDVILIKRIWKTKIKLILFQMQMTTHHRTEAMPNLYLMVLSIFMKRLWKCWHKETI